VDVTDTGPLRTAGEHRVRRTEPEALANLRTVLELCAAGELRCSDKTSRPSAATMRTLADHLTGGDFYADDPIASFAWPLLVQAGGLATIEAGRLRLTAKGRAASRTPMPEVIRALWRRWLSHGVIDEFSRIEQIKGQRARNVLSAVKPRRQAVADALAQLPSGDWVGVDALFTTMRRDRLHPTIARNDRALWKLYLVDPQYGSLGYDGYHHWEILEGRYTLAVLFEYAGTLGLVDLDYVHPDGERDDFRDQWGGDDLAALSRYDGLQAIRLTALGRYALGLTDTYDPPTDTPAAVASLKVLPTLDIVATGTVTASDRLTLTAYAEQTADRVWTISAASLLGALDTGRDLSEFTDFLTQRTDHELPGALSTLLNDVTRRTSALTDLGHARVIECADPALAALITHDRTLRGLCRPLGDCHLAVTPEHERKFRTALRKLGYVLPAQH
jgi:hypothetical protein